LTIGEFLAWWFPNFWVSWDDEIPLIIPNIWKNKKCIKMFQTTNQSFILGYSSSFIRKGPCLSEGMGLAPNRPIPADFLALNL
jgi:hypothetical protein